MKTGDVTVGAPYTGDFFGKSSNFQEERICRLCRSFKGLMSDIFSCSGVDDTSSLPERIMKFANVQIRSDDGLPSLICHRCLCHIDEALEFKKLCEESDAFLRQQLSYQMSEEGIREFDCKKEVADTGEEESFPGQTAGPPSSGWPAEEATPGAPDNGFHNPQSAEDSNQESFEEENDELNCLKCPHCNKPFDTFERLERHKFIHTTNGPFPCDFCETIVGDKATLRFHWGCHANEYASVCQTCGESFAVKEDLLRHNLIHDQVKPYHCELCTKAFFTSADLRKHSIIHTGLRPYMCEVCCKTFTRSTNLNKHRRLHTGQQPYQCVICGKVFNSRGDLRRHLVIHTGQRPFACPICTLAFNRRDKLTRHVRVHGEERLYFCPDCPSSFSRVEELSSHLQGAHASRKQTSMGALAAGGGGKPEKEKMVVSVDPSLLHEQFQSEKQYWCEVCSKGFGRKRELTRHTALHTGIRPFSCPLCSRGFIRRDKLRLHLRLRHQDQELPTDLSSPGTASILGPSYDCTVCKESFQSFQEMRSHKKIHRKVVHKEGYLCSYCLSPYKSKVRLIKHIQSLHPIQLP